MNTPSPATTEAPAATPSLEERIASVNTALDASSETAGDPGEVAVPAAGAPASPAASGDAAAQQRAAERRARLDALRSTERERVDTKAQQAASDKMARELAAERARAEAAEARAAKMVDVDSIDEAALFALAEKRQISPQRMGEWIRDAMSNPEKQAEAAALKATKTSYDPKIAALEARLAAQDEQIQSFLAEQAKAKADAQEQHETRAFLDMVKGSSERAPLAARLLATNEQEFMQMAEIAAGSVPGMGPQALLDAVEELLDGDVRQSAQTYAALFGSPSQQPAPSKPTNRAAAMANTVSNSLAQERASLVEEENLARLPIEERAARLIRSMT
jgi:hypothetical protein